MRYVAYALLIAAIGVLSAQEKSESVAPKQEGKTEAKAIDPVMKTKVDALVKKLGDDDRKIRKQAREDIAKLGKVAGPYLTPHLKHEDVEIRESVKELLATVDPYHGLKPDTAEPEFFRKRALMKGEEPKTVGEKQWLNRQGVRGRVADALEARADAMEAEEIAVQRAIAARQVAIAKAKAEEAKKIAEEKAKAEAAKKAATKKAKAEAEKKEAK